MLGCGSSPTTKVYSFCPRFRGCVRTTLFLQARVHNGRTPRRASVCNDVIFSRIDPLRQPQRGAVHRPLIPLRWIDLVEERAAFFEAADVVEDDRGGGRRIGDAGDVRGHQDARMLPKRVTRR